MKIAYAILLALLVFLAISSGAAKIALMQHDVEFFGKYGFSNTALVAFGAAQLLGGILLPFAKTRFAGATIVAVTFFASLVLLVLDGNLPVSAVTLVALLLLGAVMKKSWNTTSSKP